jgi:hypothetical protein
MTFTKTLRAITEESREIIRQLEMNDGEIDDQLNEICKINAQELAKKVDSYDGVLKELGGEIDRLDSIIKELTALKKRHKTVKERLEGNIIDAMFSLKTEKLEGNISTFEVRKNSGIPALIIEQEKLHPDFLIVEQTVVPDKNKIRFLLEHGNQIEGAELVRRFSLKTKYVARLPEKE